MSKKIMILAICLVGEMVGRSGNDASTVVEAKGPKITQVYNHVSDVRDQLVLYFSSQPDCAYIPDKNVAFNNNQPVIDADGMKRMTFFFPTRAMTAKELTKVKDQVNKINHVDYSISMRYDDNKKGVVIEVAFNDAKIGFQQESFPAITGEPALSFVFLKRNMLEAINRNSKNLFNTAFYSKKKMM